MSGRNGTIEWQYEGDNGVLFNGQSDYHWIPGDPGCRYTRNGDGWPPTAPEVEFSNHRITGLEVPLREAGALGMGLKELNGYVQVPISKEGQNSPSHLVMAAEIFYKLDIDDLEEKANKEVEHDEPEYIPDDRVQAAINRILG
jgi:hypothetical protein